MYETIESLCFIIGAYAVLSFLYRLIRPIFIFQHNLFKRYGGGWAIITGGTDGIGLGYC